MNLDKIINFLLYILGMAFNLVIMALVAYAIWFFAIQGFEFGGNFAADMTTEGTYHEFEFVLDEDTPAAEVAVTLEEMGVISSSLLFRMELFLMGRIRTYQA